MKTIVKFKEPRVYIFPSRLLLRFVCEMDLRFLLLFTFVFNTRRKVWGIPEKFKLSWLRGLLCKLFVFIYWAKI